MNKQREEAILVVLRTMADEEDGLVAALADALIHASSSPSPESAAPSNLEVRQRISSLAAQYAKSRSGSIAVVEALVKIDSRIASEASGIAPWATRLTPLAAECALNAEKDLQKETWESNQANRTPIFRLDDKTVLVVPVGEFGPETLGLISDRVSAEVLRQRTKRVVLVLHGLDVPPGSSKYWVALREDLESQKIRLEIVGGLKD